MRGGQRLAERSRDATRERRRAAHRDLLAEDGARRELEGVEPAGYADPGRRAHERAKRGIAREVRVDRAGPGVEGSGSITGVFSVLVDGDDHNDPVADAVRGALDGHIVLDRAIADEGRYPAVNILSSVSRMANPLWRPEQRKVVQNLRALIARYEETRELRLMGGYTAGSDPLLDKAIKSAPRIYEAMNQSTDAPRCEDPFIDLAAALRGDGKSNDL